MKIFLFLFLLLNVQSAKILVWPAEWSHWINMKIIIQKLVQRGHDVTVMRSHAYTDFIKNDLPNISMFDFYVPYEAGMHLRSMDQVLYASKLGHNDDISSFRTAYAMINFWYEQVSMRMDQCEHVVSNSTIMNQLNATEYDLVLADPSVMCGELIAHKLNVPFVYNVRTLPAEIQFTLSQTPMPLSYVPMINSEFSDSMNLKERTLNLLNYLGQQIGTRIGLSFMNPLVHKYINPNKGFLDIVSESSMWLIRTDFAFEYPRPLMPNVKFIGGFHCKPASSLSDIDNPKYNYELSKFIDSADNGLIVFSMGSMVRSMDKSKSEMIAAALSRLDQKVIWRYAGDKPKSLGSNTKIMDWIPQNDLIGHHKTKLFITHGGTNGLYEAIYHSVPMLGLPLLVDQFDNMLRVTERGAGLTLDITKINADDLYNALNRILTEPSYKIAAMQLSERHRDKPIHPLDEAIFWIEHTINTEGAYHLRPAAHDLYWFQYLMLDSIALITVLIYVISKVFIKISNTISSNSNGIVSTSTIWGVLAFILWPVMKS